MSVGSPHAYALLRPSPVQPRGKRNRTGSQRKRVLRSPNASEVPMKCRLLSSYIVSDLRQEAKKTWLRNTISPSQQSLQFLNAERRSRAPRSMPTCRPGSTTAPVKFTSYFSRLSNFFLGQEMYSSRRVALALWLHPASYACRCHAQKMLFTLTMNLGYNGQIQLDSGCGGHRLQ